MSLAIRQPGQVVPSGYNDDYLGLRGLPEHSPLLPEGSPIEAHFPKLYPPNRSQQQLLDYARPDAETFGALLIPAVFRKKREELRRQLHASGVGSAALAAQWLNARGDDERHLQMLLQQLIEV